MQVRICNGHRRAAIVSSVTRSKTIGHFRMHRFRQARADRASTIRSMASLRILTGG